MIVEMKTPTQSEYQDGETTKDFSNDKGETGMETISSLSTVTVAAEDDDCFDELFEDDLDSLNVDTWTNISSVPVSPRDTHDKLEDIEKQQDPCSSTNMENADERMQKCLYDIPHIITMKLMKSLDTDGGWEVLAANSGFNFDEICELRQEERKNSGSPTRSLLWKLGCQAFTMQMLHDTLKNINRIHDAEIIATYIMEGHRRPTTSLSHVPQPSKNSDSLQSYLSRISISSPPNQPYQHNSMAHAASNHQRHYSSSSGSEVNFNYQSMKDSSQTKLAGGGYKLYEDKCIPGAKVAPQSLWPPAMPAYTPSNASSSDCNNTLQHFDGSGLPSYSMCGGGSSSNYHHPPPDGSTRLLREVGAAAQSPSQMSSFVSTQSEAEVAMSVKTAFSFQELVAATDGFSDKNILGEGGFGVVYYGHLRHMDCAVKKFVKQRSEENKDFTEQIHSELAALLTYTQENIVALYGYALDGPNLCLVYQYLSNGSLEDRLTRKNNTPALSWERRQNILVGSCRAISFLHTFGSPPLIHGDIKSANILLDGHLEAKIADLGQSKYATSRSADTGSYTHITVAQGTSRQYGTKAFQAPEIRSGCSLSIHSDIYAMGVVFLETCSGLKAFDFDRNENKFLTDLYSSHITKLDEASTVREFQDRSPPDSIPPSSFLSILKLASKCISDSKKLRPSSGKLLKSMKQIYDTQYSSQRQPKSVNYPIEDDVSQTSGLHGDIASNQLNSTDPHSQQQPMSSILHLQNERYNQITQQQQQQQQQHHQQQQQQHHQQQQQQHQHHQHHPAHSPSTTGVSSVGYSNGIQSSTIDNTPFQQPPPPVSKRLLYHQQSSTSSSSSSSSSSTPSSYSGYPVSIPPVSPGQPEALLLQEHYDQLSGQLHSQNEVCDSGINQNGVSFVSNSWSKSSGSTTTTTPVKSPVEQGEGVEERVGGGENTTSSSSTSLASDPNKMAAMKMFDELGYRSINTGHTDAEDNTHLSPVSLKCDEKKLAFLNKFDDSVYRSGRTVDALNANSNTGNHETVSEKKQNGGNDCVSNSSPRSGLELNSQRKELNTFHSAENNSISATKAKELEAMASQKRQAGDKPLTSSQYHNGLKEDCRDSSPISPQATMDSHVRRFTCSAQSDAKGDNSKKVVGVAGSDADTDSHQQLQLAKREHFFMNYHNVVGEEEGYGEEGEDEWVEGGGDEREGEFV